MPKPMICLSEALRNFLELFRSGLSRFLALWPWSPTEVERICRQEMVEPVQAEHRRQRAERPRRRGRPKATVVTGYLILDDSVHSKPKGKKMAGLGRHYSAMEKKVVNGHCLYVLLGRRCPLQPRLYRQKAVCEQEGVPFQSKVDLAVAEIEAFEPVPNTHILVDSWYHCRRAARRRGRDISGGLKSNRWMRIRAIQAEHQRNLLSWLEEQFRSGATAEQLSACLVA